MEHVIFECACGAEFEGRIEATHIEDPDGALIWRENADRSCPECDRHYTSEAPVTEPLRRVKIPEAVPQG